MKIATIRNIHQSKPSSRNGEKRFVGFIKNLEI